MKTLTTFAALGLALVCFAVAYLVRPASAQDCMTSQQFVAFVEEKGWTLVGGATFPGLNFDAVLFTQDTVGVSMWGFKDNCLKGSMPVDLLAPVEEPKPPEDRVGPVTPA